MQRVTFPVSFPAYAYKVADESAGAQANRYGVQANDLVQLTPKLLMIADLAEYVVSELLQLLPLPATEEIIGEYQDLSDEDWGELNRNLGRLADGQQHSAG